jgi:glucan phosphorylase
VELRRGRYNPREIYNSDEQIRWAIDLIERDFFSMLEAGVFRPLIQSLLSDDSYMLLADFRSYYRDTGPGGCGLPGSQRMAQEDYPERRQSREILF